jgi:DNA-binding transcriptional LysR family regulator
MEFMQLEMFVALVEERGVRGAAERVYRTQPAVSIAIRKLESELEVSLFDRTQRHHYPLTRAGEVLYAYAKRMLNLRKEVGGDLDDLTKLRSGRLRIGAGENINLHLLPRLTQTFLQHYPGIHVELKFDRASSLLADLKARQLDLALASSRPDDQDFSCSLITQDELVLITAPKHPLLRKAQVETKDLTDETLLMVDAAHPSSSDQIFSESVVTVKTPLHLKIENAPIETIKTMVAIGLGVAFVPMSCVRDEILSGDLAMINVEDCHPERSVWLVRRWAAQSNTIEAFARIAQEFGEKSIQWDGRANLGENSRADSILVPAS